MFDLDENLAQCREYHRKKIYNGSKSKFAGLSLDSGEFLWLGEACLGLKHILFFQCGPEKASNIQYIPITSRVKHLSHLCAHRPT